MLSKQKLKTKLATENSESILFAFLIKEGFLENWVIVSSRYMGRCCRMQKYKILNKDFILYSILL